MAQAQKTCVSAAAACGARAAQGVVVLLPSERMLVLGAWGIRRQGAIWQDEAVAYDMAHRSPADLWQRRSTWMSSMALTPC